MCFIQIRSMPISRVVYKHLTSAGVKFIFSPPNV